MAGRTRHAWLVDPQDECRVSRAEWEAAYEAARRDLLPTRPPDPRRGPPEFFLTGGAPGSGKNSVAHAYVRRRGRHPPSSYVYLDFDAAVKYHPRFRDVWSLPDVRGFRPGPGAAHGWNLCASSLDGLLSRIAYELMDGGYNIVMQSHQPERLVEAKERGYRTVYLFVGAPARTCVRRARERALETGMFLAPTLTAQQRHVENHWHRMRALAPYRGVWADEFALVANGRPKVPPERAAAGARILRPHEEAAPGWGARRAWLQDHVEAALGNGAWPTKNDELGGKKETKKL
jgi:hypothetical protein